MTMAQYTRAQKRQYRKVRQSFILPITTGWNDDSNHQALLDSDLSIAKNLCLYRADLLGGRFGFHRDPYAAALNGGAAITGLFDYKSEKDATHRPIVVCGDKIFAESAGADPSTGTDVTGTAVVNTAATNLVSACVFKDNLIMTQMGGTAATHVPFYIGPSGNAAPLAGWYANGRTADYVHTQFGYLFFAGFNRTGSPGTNQHPMSVMHGELQDSGTWLELNIIDKIGGLSVYGDEYVTGMFRHRDFLMIGTNRRIYPVVYSGDVAALWIIQRPLDVGLSSQHSVISINGEFTFFMDPQGNIHAIHEVARGFGAVGVRAMSRKIKNHVSNFSRSTIKYAVGKYMSERGWCVWSVPYGIGATSKNELLVLDINNFPLDNPDHRVATWFRWTGVSANVLEVMTRDTSSVANTTEPSVTGEQFLYFGTTTGWTKRFTDTISYDEADAGTQTPIDTDMASKWFDFGQADDQKSIVEMRYVMEPAQIAPGPNAHVEYDFGAGRSNTEVVDMDSNLATDDVLDSTFVLDTSTLGNEVNIATSKDYFREAGVNARVRLQRQLTGTDKWKLQQLTMLVEMRGESPESVGRDS